MRSSKIIYRVKQFFSALFASVSTEDLAIVSGFLSAEQLNLFNKLQRSEQVHAIAVTKQCLAQGHHQPDLLTAALLHDIGKTRFPIRLWERVFLVLMNSFDDAYIKKRRPNVNEGIFRIFRIAEEHPAWGADLAEQGGASKLTVSLIMRHQDEIPINMKNEENRLLEILQNNDNAN